MQLVTPTGLVVAAAAALSLSLLLAPQAEAMPRRARVPRAMTVSVLAAAAVLIVPNAWIGPVLVLTPAAWTLRLLWTRRTAARLAETNAACMAEVCDLLAAELSAGRPPDAALREAAATWLVMRPVAEVSRLGGDVPAALREASAAPGASELALLAAAWTVARRTGGGLGAATRRVAEAVRRQQATRGVVAGELASARATARLMAGLPVVALLMGSGAGADPWSFLLATPAGLACLAGGLLTGIAGLFWIEQIAREVDS